MSLAALNSVTKEFAGKAVLDDVSFELPRGCRAGLVGENGSGKSTILKLIARKLKPDSGTVPVTRSTHPWYVPQVPDLQSERAAYEEVLASRPHLLEIRTRMLSLEDTLDSAHAKDEGSAASYAEAVAEFSDLGGYEFEREARDALRALGIRDEQLILSVERLSGGERARVALAKAILAAPSLLLLDEPDNHLDIEGIKWLEGMLNRYRGGFVLVTHDRELLDRVVDSIMEVEDGKVTCERGGFCDYLRRKEKKLALQKERYLEQQRGVRKLKEAISRLDGKARGVENRTIHFHYRKRALKVARRASVLKSRIERQLEGKDKIEKPRDGREGIRLELAPKKWHAATVLRLDRISKSFAERALFADVNLDLSRGQRIAIVGPNGSGKTTLMEIALGIQPADEGDVWLSSAASVFYCDQRHAGLKDELTVYDSVASETDLTHNQIHYLLARLLFKGPAVRKRVGDLSGGERTRLVLALLMNTRADLLMLDEPTNHLDLPGIEILQEALRNFPGAVMFISHDRRLVSAVATDAFGLTNGTFRRSRNESTTLQRFTAG